MFADLTELCSTALVAVSAAVRVDGASVSLLVTDEMDVAMLVSTFASSCSELLLRGVDSCDTTQHKADSGGRTQHD